MPCRKPKMCAMGQETFKKICHRCMHYITVEEAKKLALERKEAKSNQAKS